MENQSSIVGAGLIAMLFFVVLAVGFVAVSLDHMNSRMKEIINLLRLTTPSQHSSDSNKVNNTDSKDNQVLEYPIRHCVPNKATSYNSRHSKKCSKTYHD